MRSALFWNITRRRVEPTRCPETSVNIYHATPRNIPEERRSQQRRGGSPKSRLDSMINTRQANVLQRVRKLNKEIHQILLNRQG
jgi:hypothetical protein